MWQAWTPVLVHAGYGSRSLAVLRMQELRKWVDTSSENAHLLLHAKAEARAKRWVGSRGKKGGGREFGGKQVGGQGGGIVGLTCVG